MVLGFFIAFETIGLCHESLAFTVPLFNPVNMKVQLMLEIMLILFFVGVNGKGMHVGTLGCRIVQRFKFLVTTQFLSDVN